MAVQKSHRSKSKKTLKNLTTKIFKNLSLIKPHQHNDKTTPIINNNNKIKLIKKNTINILL